MPPADTIMWPALRSSDIKPEIRGIIQKLPLNMMGYTAQKDLYGPSQHPCGPSQVADHNLPRGIVIGIIYIFTPNSLV